MQKKDLPPDNKFCYYPWRGAHIMPDGNVVACCHQTYGHYGVEDFPIKQNLADKSLEKITSEAAVNSISDGGGGSGGDPLGEMGDLLDIFFNQGTYNGTLKVNGGIVVDYVESSEGTASGQTDINTVRSMINSAITANNRRQAFGGGLAGASSIGSLSGTIIKGANISGSSITGGIMRGTRVEDLQGLNELFRRDYLDLYSINIYVFFC